MAEKIVPVDLDEITRRFYPATRARIFARLGDRPDDCLDALNEVFLELTRLARAGHFQDPKTIGGAIKKMIDGKINDIFRREYREKEGIKKVPAGMVGDDQIFSYEISSEFQKVMDALATLTSRQKEIFILMGLEEMTAKAAAEKMKISADRAAVLFSRTKKRLKEILSQETRIEDPDLDGWLEKFFTAYLRLGIKTGRLTPEIQAAAEDGYRKIMEILQKPGICD